MEAVSMGVLMYRPTSVQIPEDSACRRDFLSRHSTVDNARLTEADYREYDSRTIFYDVFRCDDRKLVAIGPPPVNLRNELEKLRITCGGRMLPHHKREYRRLCVLELTCDQPTNAGKNLPLRFSFPSFDVDIEVPPPLSTPAEASPLGLMTLQRNNPLPWILDWCWWHHRLHGVSRLVLYDNASDNRDDLVVALTRMDEAIDIVLVDWPFPYGPRRNHKNFFCQTGALNHYLLRFGSADAWCLNLDIDEYLVASGNKTFTQYLHECDGNGVVEVMFDSFIVPPHQGQPAMANRRVNSYWFRNRERRGRALKFAFKPRDIEYVGPHMAYPKNRAFAKLLGLPRLYDKTLQSLYGSVLRRLTSTRIFRLFFPNQFALRYPSPDELFFYHFRGLNTNWKPGRDFGEALESFDASRHVSDARIGALFVRTGLDNGLPSLPTGRSSVHER